jgi:hypothetical protein
LYRVRHHWSKSNASSASDRPLASDDSLWSLYATANSSMFVTCSFENIDISHGYQALGFDPVVTSAAQ